MRARMALCIAIGATATLTMGLTSASAKGQDASVPTAEADPAGGMVEFPTDPGQPQRVKVPIWIAPTPRAPTTEPAATEFYSWALLNRRTGRVIGSANATTGTSSTESMIKAWIGADYLMGLRARGSQPSQFERQSIHDMIHLSDDDAAERLYRARDGNDVIRRLIATCGLTNTHVFSGWWSKTEMSARDAAMMGSCIADAQPAGPAFTKLLLTEMRTVDPSNAFGISEASVLRGRAVAVKNGWTARATGNWHLNCLALWDTWSLAVQTRYPHRLGQDYGAAICRSVTEQLFAPQRAIGPPPT